MGGVRGKVLLSVGINGVYVFGRLGGRGEINHLSVGDCMNAGTSWQEVNYRLNATNGWETQGNKTNL